MSQTKFSNPISNSPTSPMSPSPSAEGVKGGVATNTGASARHEKGAPGSHIGRDGDASKEAEKESE